MAAMSGPLGGPYLRHHPICQPHGSQLLSNIMHVQKNHSCMEYIVLKYSWVKAEGTGNGRILSLPLHTSGTKLHVGLGFPSNVCNGAVKTS